MKLVPLILAIVILQQLPANQTAELPPGTFRPGQGVTSPVLLRETKPNYTAEAMRARIQGVVVLECVVMPDGTVAQVRVVRSLDPVYGLDEEAMKSLNQWRFQPGMKDGAAVPVLITVEMSFRVGRRDDTAPANTPPGGAMLNGDAPAPLTWPDAFSSTSPTSATIVDGALHHPTLDITFSYPSSWSIVESTEGTTLYAEDSSGMRAITISAPQPAQFSLMAPLSRSALDSFTVAAQMGAASLTTPRVIKSGQVLRDGGLWIWFEMAAPQFASWNMSGALADRLRSGYGGIHVWSFATTVSGQSISVFCTVVHRAGLSEADQQDQIRRAGTELAEILKRISFQAR